MINRNAAPLSLKVPLAQRVFSLFRPDGSEVQVTARLGQPYRDESLGDWRCALQVLGLGNERVYAPWGEDPFVALQYAIDYIGQLLDEAVARQQLHDSSDRVSVTENRWIWRYPPDRLPGRE
jgi:hypothetical protein